MLTAYEPRMTMMAEWFKQLYGESEGKDNKGLFPRKRHFLHRPSFLGQYIQDGVRSIFETVVLIDSPERMWK